MGEHDANDGRYTVTLYTPKWPKIYSDAPASITMVPPPVSPIDAWFDAVQRGEMSTGYRNRYGLESTVT
jgi:hypothetical protein